MDCRAVCQCDDSIFYQHSALHVFLPQKFHLTELQIESMW